jgi:hypothetical protein
MTNYNIIQEIKLKISQEYKIRLEAISDQIVIKILSRLTNCKNNADVLKLILEYLPNELHFIKKSDADDFLHLLLNYQIKLK